jgi:CRP-like cAMP-binding protein
MATALNRSISATVKTDVALVRIAKKDFVAVVSRASTFALDIMSILAGRAPPTGRFDHNNSDSRSL